MGNHSVSILCNASTQTSSACSCVSDCSELQKEVNLLCAKINSKTHQLKCLSSQIKSARETLANINPVKYSVYALLAVLHNI